MNLTPSKATGATPPDPPSIYGRFELMRAIRWGCWPEAWASLNVTVWRSPPDLFPLRWLDWIKFVGISDQWFYEEAAIPTLANWMRNPNSPDANLDPSYEWFTYKPAERLMENPLTVIDRSYKVTGDSQEALQRIANLSGKDLEEEVSKTSFRMETGPERKKRLLEEFERALDNDDKRRARLFGGNRNDDMQVFRTHAQWTALRLAKVPTRTIATEWPGIERYRGHDKENLVYRSVQRFCKEIGLTLPGRKSTGQAMA